MVEGILVGHLLCGVDTKHFRPEWSGYIRKFTAPPLEGACLPWKLNTDKDALNKGHLCIKDTF